MSKKKKKVPAKSNAPQLIGEIRIEYDKKTTSRPGHSRQRFYSNMDGRTKLERLVASMTLDEMLDACSAIDIAKKEGNVPDMGSPKVDEYVEATVRMYRNNVTRQEAERLQQYLVTQIIKKNKATTDPEEGRRLYRELMKE